jgi:hypothetical protein
MEAEARHLVFDHCHAHGWVRGLVCVPCNNRLMHIETGLRPCPPEWGCWDYPAGIERQAARRRSDGDGVVWLR